MRNNNVLKQDAIITENVMILESFWQKTYQGSHLRWPMFFCNEMYASAWIYEVMHYKGEQKDTASCA